MIQLNHPQRNVQFPDIQSTFYLQHGVSLYGKILQLLPISWIRNHVKTMLGDKVTLFFIDWRNAEPQKHGNGIIFRPVS